MRLAEDLGFDLLWFRMRSRGPKLSSFRDNSDFEEQVRYTLYI